MLIINEWLYTFIHVLSHLITFTQREARAVWVLIWILKYIHFRCMSDRISTIWRLWKENKSSLSQFLLWMEDIFQSWKIISLARLFSCNLIPMCSCSLQPILSYNLTPFSAAPRLRCSITLLLSCSAATRRRFSATHWLRCSAAHLYTILFPPWRHAYSQPDVTYSAAI